MALQSNRQTLSNQNFGAEESRKKSTRIGNVKKPKKLLSDRFGSIAKMDTELKNPQEEECGASVNPLNQELIDFERGTLKRKYNNLKVNVKLGVTDPTLSGPGSSYSQITHCDANQRNVHGSVLLSKDANVIKPFEESPSLLQNAEGQDRHGMKLKASSRPDCNVLDMEQAQIHAQRVSHMNIKSQPLPTSTSEAIKRPFFYAEQNSVPPKKRFTIDQELQPENQKIVDSFDRCTKNNMVKCHTNGNQRNFQQGESTPSSTSSEQNVIMLFEGRTLLKGGVNPRHIPKNVIERDDKEPPSDPRILRPSYGQQNQVIEYKVLMWHKDWLLDYTRMLLDARKSHLKKREHERCNASLVKEEIKKSEDPNNKEKQHPEALTMENKKVDSRLSELNEQKMEDSKMNTLKSAVSRLVEDVRMSGTTNKQCFEYRHSRVKTEVLQNSHDPRLMNRYQQQSNNAERMSHKSNEMKKEPYNATACQNKASRTFKSDGEKRGPKSQRYDKKLKYMKKNSPDGVCMSRGKTGAVLREDSQCNSPNFDSEDKEFKILPSTAMHSTYYNKNLSPIYQEREYYNSYRKPLPKAYQVCNKWNSKGKDGGLDRFPQFSQQNWY